MPPAARSLNSLSLTRFLISAICLVLLGFFLSRPFVESASDAATYPRWLLLFAPVDDPTFATFVWRGLGLPDEPPTGERWLALGLGHLATLALLGVGSLVVAPFKRVLKTSVFETLFFQFGAGFAICQLYFLAAGLRGVADAPILFPTLAFAALYVVSTLIATSRRLFARRESQRLDAASFFPLKTIADRVLFSLLIPLTALFTLFYILASTQPLFEYDVLEYHAQAAREIFETGALAFAPNNVYANMPLGAETLYVWGFNLVRDLSVSPDAPLRLGSLVGKVVLTNAAFATGLGLFGFCVRFFRDARAGLLAALVYLSFPSVFDVFANGLNDGALGLALFSVFYALALTFAADAPRWSRLSYRVATAVFVGIYVGLALSVKFTAVVFVFAPTFAALAVAPFIATPLRRLLRFDAQTVSASTVASDERLDETRSRALSKQTLINVAISLVVFVATSAVVAGGWFARNVEATGNPFHPLAYGIFGDASQTWDADVDARWRRAHSASTSGFAALAESTARSGWRADLASPFFLFVPLVVFIALTLSFSRLSAVRSLFDGKSLSGFSNDAKLGRDATLFALIAAVALAFWLVWHFATHRLARFLVPNEPLVALLLGLATSFAASAVFSRASSAETTARRSKSGGAFAVFAFYATLLIGLLYSGLVIDVRAPGRIAPLRALERDPARFPQAALFFNDRPELFAEVDATASTTSVSEASARPKPTRKLLLVGEAKAFAYRVPVLYSTCWDRSPLVPLLGDSVERDADGKIVAIRNADAIRRRFADAKIAFVSVDFAELARFRSPGNYGFRDDEIDENLFRLLTSANVLERFELPPNAAQDDATSPARPAAETTQIFRPVAP